MHGYELTERGKILVAIVLVLLLLLVPSAILLYTAMAGQASPPPADNDAQASGDYPPLIAEMAPSQSIESPPPTGGGFNPPDISYPNAGGNPGGQYPTSPPGLGQPSVDHSEGTLSFFFSPGIQNTLDVETASMLGIFLSSPKNSPDSLIAVEIPILSEDYTEKTTSAVISAFAARGVREQRLSFRTGPDEAADGPFKVSLYFFTQPEK